MSPHHAQLPSWLIEANESAHYIDGAWATLASREQQRLLASSASHPRKAHRPVHGARANIDPELTRHYSTSTGLSTANKLFNRYFDVVPYDRNRVILPGSGQRYLNASWVQTRASGRWFVATQAPLVWTANSFLSLTVAGSTSPQGHHFKPVRTVVQLTPEWEGRIRKADPYFPNEIGETWTFEPESEGVSPSLNVRLVRRALHEEMNCVESELRIRPEDREDEEVAVVHLLYTAWPDHGVPEQSESLLRFVRYCEQVNSRGDRGDRHHQAPMAVGCSAGIGRTGSFITISSLLEVLRDSPETKPPDGRSPSTQAVLSSPGFGGYSEDLVVLEIDWLREQRAGMVQRREQMEMIYGILCA